jgi:Fe-Mn family superoxide dismutase
MGNSMSEKLHLQKVNYNYKDLSPVMSEDTLKYHRDNLAAAYVKKYNNGEGDANFNEAGAFLHNIFFPQLKKPSGSNKPYGAFLTLVNDKYGSYDNFKEELKKTAMSIQGSGWVYLDSGGEVKTIKNHEVKRNIVLLIDWWEHAWALDYQSDKSKYLDNIWKIIDWDVVNDRINVKESCNRRSILKKIYKFSMRQQ